MNIKVLLKEKFLTAKSLLIQPEKEWNFIIKENQSYQSVIFGAFLPGIVCLFLVQVFNHLLYHDLEILLWDVVIVNSLRIPLTYCFSMLATIKGAQQLLKNYGVTPNRNKTATLFVYAFIPFFLASLLVSLVPFLGMLWIVAFYSFRLLLVGYPKFYDLKEENKNNFFMLSILIWISSFVLFNFLFSRILPAIL